MACASSSKAPDTCATTGRCDAARRRLRDRRDQRGRLAALDASTASLEAHGIEQIHAHVQPILDGLECAFASHGFVSARHSDPGARSCILSLRPPADVDLASLAAALGNRGVSVATPDGYLRLSPHWPNDLSQVAPSVAALEDSLRELRS